ncbi:MAG: Rne/Rng family ribonuclease [Candidatus Omnitrophica bacterium]|nr:Rne/Rng family ribonuclease [Candidatus Omnitrophota bacterium]
MKKEILMSLEANEKRVVILEDGKLEEFFIERSDTYKMFGNIYKGKVKSIVPGIGASFIDLGTKKDGFLYVADAVESPFGLESAFEEVEYEGKKVRGQTPRIDEVLKIGQEVFVQVVKEPIRDKGPRLTTHVAIPARYLVLIPGENKVGVSRRIDDARERDRIREIFSQVELPKDSGFIVRTAGEGKDKREFTRDIKYLIKTWSRIKSEIHKKKAPSLIHQELDLVERIIRDYFTEDIERIVVDHQNLYHQVCRFLKSYLPGCRVRVDWHKNQSVSLFDQYKIEKEIEKTFQKKVFLHSGGHIVIEQTEGLVAIDVNTGKFTGHRNLEETVYRTNLEAAQEISRQVRLRDMGGIIIIDFIDMSKPDHRRHLYRLFKDVVKKDRAKTNILQMSELGLVEMTRQRIRPSLESAVHETCSYCEGKGIIKSVTTMTIQTLKEVKKALNHSTGKILNVYVHPQVAERLLHDEKRSLRDLEQAAKSRVIILADPSLHREDVNITLVK